MFSFLKEKLSTTTQDGCFVDKADEVGITPVK
jgi:hypothetical protein